VPDRLDPFDSSRSKSSGDSDNLSAVTHKVDNSEDAVPPSVSRTLDNSKNEALPELPRTCTKVANELRDLRKEAISCFDANEIKKLTGIYESNVMPVCISVIIAMLSFVIGVYVTKRGLISKYI
jgi:hypothetical protein